MLGCKVWRRDEGGEEGIWVDEGGCLGLPESVEKAVYAVGRLIFEDFDAAFHLWGKRREMTV